MSSTTSEYFLLAVSNKINLDLCLRYALAGFPSTLPGVWAFADISEGDYVSLLYGAKVYNLYQVERKYAINDSEKAGPWPPVTFKMWNKTYYFPFRLQLKPIRKFEESLIRIEFEYVGENLLLRGGYRKTHFQADHLTLLNVTNLGDLWESEIKSLALLNPEYIPEFTSTAAYHPPYSFRLQEIILQSAIRRHLRIRENLERLLEDLKLHLDPNELEVLGEKALQEGNVDILIKERRAFPRSNKMIIEVKNGSAKAEDVDQTRRYAETLGKECLAAALFAKHFPKSVIAKANEAKIALFRFDLSLGANTFNFEELVNGLSYVKI